MCDVATSGRKVVVQVVRRQKKGCHATKALAHLARKGKHDVAPCRGKIEKECLLVCQKMWDARVAAHNARTSAKNAAEGRDDDHHHLMTETHQSKRRRVSGSMSSPHLTVSLGQSRMDTGHETLLTATTADWSNRNGLAFGVTDQPLFGKTLRLAKSVRHNYVPPSSKATGNELLELNCESLMRSMKEGSLKTAAVFGLSFCGDGATVG